MICSVFGHRDIENDVDETALKNLFLSLIQEKEVDTFYFGGFGDFDELCHKLITELKSNFPFIRRVYCLTDEKHLLPRKRPRFLQDEDYEDFIFLPLSFYGWYKRIYFRNLAMIDASDFVIFYAKKRPDSGAYKAYQYAVKVKKTIFNIVSDTDLGRAPFLAPPV